MMVTTTTGQGLDPADHRSISIKHLTRAAVFYLYVFDNSIIADVSLSSNSCRRKGVGHDIQQDLPP